MVYFVSLNPRYQQEDICRPRGIAKSHEILLVLDGTGMLSCEVLGTCNGAQKNGAVAQCYISVVTRAGEIVELHRKRYVDYIACFPTAFEMYVAVGLFYLFGGAIDGESEVTAP
jgi:hypothetical protein